DWRAAIIRSPSGDIGSPRASAYRSLAENPARTSAPTTDPADVPTTRSASRGSHPVASASAPSTPAWNAWPPMPPAPSTTGIRGTTSGIAHAVVSANVRTERSQGWRSEGAIFDVEEAAMRRRVGESRVARLATVTPEGRPHVVPCCYALV